MLRFIAGYREKGVGEMPTDTKSSSLDYAGIGRRIKEKRREKNITQEMLAETMDISMAYLSRIERGKENVNIERLLIIAETLQVDVGELISGTSPGETGLEPYFWEEIKSVLRDCTAEKQKLIYNVAKIIAGIDFKKEKKMVRNK